MGVRQSIHGLRHGTGRTRAFVAVPFALIATVTVVDIVVPPEVHLGPFLVAAPALTASFAGPRLTAFVGAVAVLAQAVVALARTSITDLNHMYQIAALFLISAIVTFFAHLRERHAAEMVQLRTVAEAAQRSVLRPLPGRSGPLRLASVYLAAEEGAQLGGDLYATARTHRGTRVIIGDVRGKGLDAISGAAGVLGAFRALARQEDHLPGLVARLESSVAAQQIDSLTEAEDPDDDQHVAEAFVTAAVLDLPDAVQELRLVSCGHPPPLLLRAGRVENLDATEPAPPLGVGPLTAGGHTEDVFAFRAGDVLLLYTDGVTEARNGSGVFYPLAERVASWPGVGPETLLERVCADLLRHAGGRLGDDAALVAVERLPGSR
ncbi:PP2C family protein-serine/threonine phosphatase [Streptomyces sp. QL37]|uniref:PP2C family protein-serine/threonine phosphatase n=1 Tax=Streptomyces sp. QL37 TaxID=2093747 RepID=UPI000CF2D425|nr:PP2C family protein-serine/threonine phosphatase [Streptomyces sp. QL37]PPQ62671.1 protein phosphatase [Streptomyces sp. QL37]